MSILGDEDAAMSAALYQASGEHQARLLMYLHEAFMTAHVLNYPIRPVETNVMIRFNRIKNCWQYYKYFDKPSITHLDAPVWEIVHINPTQTQWVDDQHWFGLDL